MNPDPHPAASVVFNAKDLIASAREGLALLRAGRAREMRTTVLERPRLVCPLAPAKIREIRRRLGASPEIFAALLNVPKGTAASWEAGARRPSGAALKLLRVAAREPRVLLEA